MDKSSIKFPTLKEKLAARIEDRRQKMMLAAAPKLRYYETVRQSTEDMWNDSDAFGEVNTEAMQSSHNEHMKFLDTKIRESKMDAEGKKRYLYTVKMDEDNGDEIFRNQVEFTTAEEVHAFMTEKTMNDDAKERYGYEKTPYTVPTVAEMETLLENKTFGGFMNIFACGDEDTPDINFAILRDHVNY